MLKQMKIIVTGAASGIGKEIVRESLLNNASVIADTVLFLLSNKARSYTGATFDINNGCYLR